MKHILSCVTVFLLFFGGAVPAFAETNSSIFPFSAVTYTDIWQNRIALLPKVKPLKKDGNPIKIALQVGHWKTNESPNELADLRESNGAKSGSIREWEVNFIVAQKTAHLLRNAGYQVDILPVTISPEYKADIFIALHADQSRNSTLSGFKAAGAANDKTGKAASLARILDWEYTQTTGMRQDNNITVNMTDYYAFNRQRFKHSISDKTIGVIVENGFLTNPLDQHILLNYPEIPAQGLANGIITFVNYNM